MTLRTWTMLVVLGLIWGGSFVFARVAVAEIPVFMLVFFRVFIACVTLHVVLRAAGRKFPLAPGTLLSFAIMGTLNNAIPFSLLFLGQTAIGAGLAAILNAMTPIFTFLVAAGLLRRESFQLHRIIGVGLGFAGVMTMFSGNLAGAASDPLWAQLCCLGAALSYAFAATYGRVFKDMNPMTAAAGQLTASSAIMLPVAILTAGAWSISSVSLLVWANVFALGLLATAAAYLIFFRLLSEAGATNTAVVTLIVPASALVFGALLLGERLQPSQIAGLLLLLAGLIALDGRLFAKRRQART